MAIAVQKIKETISPLLNAIASFFKAKTSKGIPAYISVILIVLFVFSSGYPFENVRLISSIVAFILLLFCYCFFCFPFRLWKRGFSGFLSSFNDKSLLFCFFCSAWMLVSLLLSHNYSHPFATVRYILVMVDSLLFSLCFSFSEFSLLYRKTLFVICFYSFFFFLVSYFTGSFFSSTVKESNSDSYYYVFYYSYFWRYLSGGTRNHGIFWEPGLFSSFILLALIFECLDSKRDVFKIAVFSLCILTTFSMAGYILFPATLALFVLKKYHKKWTLIFPFLCFVCLFFVYLFPTQFVGLLDKYAPTLSEKGVSLTTRLFVPGADLQVFFEYPVFGNGGGYSEEIAALISSKYSSLIDVSVSTPTVLIATYGWLGIVLFFIFVFSILFLPTRNLPLNLTLLFVLLLIISKEPHYLSLFSVTSCWYAFQNGLLQFFSKEPDSGTSLTLVGGRGKA